MFLALVFCLTFACPAFGAGTASGIGFPAGTSKNGIPSFTSKIPTLPGSPLVIPIPNPTIATNPPSNEQIKQFIESDSFQQGLSQYLQQNLVRVPDLKNLESLISQQMVKDLVNAMLLNDPVKIKGAMDNIVAQLQAGAPQLMGDFAPLIAEYSSDALAGLLITQGYPGTKAELKAKLYPVILGVLTGQVPANADAITNKLIEAGVDPNFAPYLAYGIALMTSDQMIELLAPIIAIIIVDIIGQIIGIPLLPSIKAQLVAQLTPIIEKILKETALLIDYQLPPTMVPGLLIIK